MSNAAISTFKDRGAMQIVWDESKRSANLQKHALDFADITFAFFVSARLAEARNGRYQALGILNGKAVTVIFSRLGSEAFSLVSLRPANSAERGRL